MMSDEHPLPRVLCVDDDEASRRLVEVALRGLDVEVLLCGDSKLVLDLVATMRPVAMVLDVMMPGVDGPTLVRRIHDAGLEVVPKIVLWSAMGASDLQLRARECGADAIALKVAGPDVLRQQIARWLER